MDEKTLGSIVFFAGIVLALMGFLMAGTYWGLLLVIPGVIGVVYGRDMRVGVKGTFMEHLTGKKFRERNK
jgi:hypothetical protein